MTESHPLELSVENSSSMRDTFSLFFETERLSIAFSKLHSAIFTELRKEPDDLDLQIEKRNVC